MRAGVSFSFLPGLIFLHFLIFFLVNTFFLLHISRCTLATFLIFFLRIFTDLVLYDYFLKLLQHVLLFFFWLTDQVNEQTLFKVITKATNYVMFRCCCAIYLVLLWYNCMECLSLFPFDLL